MSGPITAGYFLMHGLLLLSARALREARAMQREFGDVRAQLEQRDAELAQSRQRQRDARLERMAATRRRADAQRARLAGLESLAEALSAPLPHRGRAPAAAPAADDDAAWNAYLAELAGTIAALETVLAQASGPGADRVREALAQRAAVPGIDEVLAGYVLQRQLQPGLDAAQVERFRATAARVLDRLELPAGAVVPPSLAALARDIVLAPSVERAEALATELRRAVQHEHAARQAQAAAAAEARQLLEALPDAAPESLQRALERVAAGSDGFDAALRAAAAEVVTAAADDRERLEQQAAAIVLEESLRDLGYEVEAIDATLFVDGGTVHFRRPGWDPYHVRLRLDADEHTINCNVVRARGDEDSAERRRLDALAEDRWCAEFPRLLQTLAARGLRLDVTRRLGAGEVPVQVVDGATLPQRVADESAPAPRAAPRARHGP